MRTVDAWNRERSVLSHGVFRGRLFMRIRTLAATSKGSADGEPVAPTLGRELADLCRQLEDQLVSLEELIERYPLEMSPSRLFAQLPLSAMEPRFAVPLRAFAEVRWSEIYCIGRRAEDARRQLLLAREATDALSRSICAQFPVCAGDLHSMLQLIGVRCAALVDQVDDLPRAMTPW